MLEKKDVGGGDIILCKAKEITNEMGAWGVELEFSQSTLPP